MGKQVSEEFPPERPGPEGEFEQGDVLPPIGLRIPVKGMALVGATAIILLALHILVDVTARSFFNRPLPGTLDYVQYWWMPILCWAGILYAQYTNEHITVETVFENIDRRWARILRRAVLAVCILFFLMIAYFGLQKALEAIEINEFAAVSNLPIWAPKLATPIASFLTVGVLVWQFIRVDVFNEESEIPSDSF